MAQIMRPSCSDMARRRKCVGCGQHGHGHRIETCKSRAGQEIRKLRVSSHPSSCDQSRIRCASAKSTSSFETGHKGIHKEEIQTMRWDQRCQLAMQPHVYKTGPKAGQLKMLCSAFWRFNRKTTSVFLWSWFNITRYEKIYVPDHFKRQIKEIAWNCCSVRTRQEVTRGRQKVKDGNKKGGAMNSRHGEMDSEVASSINTLGSSIPSILWGTIGCI